MPQPCQFCGRQLCTGIAGECPGRVTPEPDYDPDGPDDDCEDCPECGGEGYVEDESDPLNDAGYDPKTGATVFPLAPCPLCNPDGERIEADELIDDEEA